ncbi:metalloregulator ArsR/SmtB family transcription factor [Marinobacteraceae bacterium S3BR75-40.1]
MSERRRVLFLCSANSARSLMAEALLKDMAGDRFEVFSAGIQPVSPAPKALQVIQEAGLDTTDLHSKPLDALDDTAFDYAITLCNKAARECQNLSLAAQQLAWDFPDPARRGTLAAYRLAFQDIRKRLQLFVTVHERQTPTGIQASMTPPDVFRLLGDETRARTVLLLRHLGELCVCELTQALAMSQPKISRHLKLLREGGLLSDQRKGQWVYYRLHPLLPDWVVQVINTTEAANRPWLQQELQRLHKPGSEKACLPATGA